MQDHWGRSGGGLPIVASLDQTRSYNGFIDCETKSAPAAELLAMRLLPDFSLPATMVR